MQPQKKFCPIVLSFASNFETSFRMNISIRQKHVKYMYVYYCWVCSLCVGSHTCILETSRKVLGLEPKLILVVVRFTFFSKKDTLWGLSKYFRKNVLCNKVNCWKNASTAAHIPLTRSLKSFKPQKSKPTDVKVDRILNVLKAIVLTYCEKKLF